MYFTATKRIKPTLRNPARESDKAKPHKQPPTTTHAFQSAPGIPCVSERLGVDSIMQINSQSFIYAFYTLNHNNIRPMQSAGMDQTKLSRKAALIS
jgi:hypothetical protein